MIFCRMRKGILKALGPTRAGTPPSLSRASSSVNLVSWGKEWRWLLELPLAQACSHLLLGHHPNYPRMWRCVGNGASWAGTPSLRLQGAQRCSELLIVSQPASRGAHRPHSPPPAHPLSPSHPRQASADHSEPAVLLPPPVSLHLVPTARNALPWLLPVSCLLILQGLVQSPSSGRHGDPDCSTSPFCCSHILLCPLPKSHHICLHLSVFTPASLPRDSEEAVKQILVLGGGGQVGLGWGVAHIRRVLTPLLPTLVMLKLMLKLCPSPSTCHTHTLQARSLVLGLTRSKVKVQCRYCCVPFQM